MLKTVFFDLGNVLIFFSHEKMVEQLAECTGLSQDIIWKMLIDEKIGPDYESGRLSTYELIQIFQKRAIKPFSSQEFLKAASDIFTPNVEMFSLIEELKGKGVRLVLLSNISECHFQFVFSKYSILKLFDDFALSFKIGAMKPSSEIFLKALSLANCEVKNCFYTDDVPEFIAEAKKVGLQGTVFTGVEALKKELNGI